MRHGHILGLSKHDQINVADLKTISDEITDFDSLNIDIAATNLQIKKGETFKVETNNSKISYQFDNGKITIKENNKNLFKIHNDYQSNLFIYIPEHIEIINSIKIKGGAGSIDINALNAENFELELGAGQTQINNCQANNLKADVGAGEFVFSGKLRGDSNIDAGIGAVKINLFDDLNQYSIKVTKGIGNITIDGEKVQDNKTYGNGNNHIKINGGIGSIDIKSAE